MLIVTELVLRETQCIRRLHMETVRINGSLGLKKIISCALRKFQCLHFFTGIPYESYKGFHEWRYELSEIRYTTKYILGIFEKVPGLLEALGKEHKCNI